MTNTDFMKGLMGKMQETISKADTIVEGSWYACEACLKAYKASSAPEACPICGKKDIRQWVGADKDEAIGRATRSVNLQHKPTPIQEPKAQSEARKELEDKCDELGLKHSKRMANKTLAKLIENKEKEIEELNNEPEVVEEEEVKTVEEEVADKPDYKELRKKAIQKFIKDNNLNEVSPVAVGTAEVQLIGFTVWSNKKPAFRFMQPFETPTMFQTVYNEARAEQPSTAIDVVQANNVSNKELKSCLYNGDMVISLNNGNGTMIARPGDIIQVGALKTGSGFIRFIALKVDRQ